jgi:drug/metabolite transporter (DMT)-like permease
MTGPAYAILGALAFAFATSFTRRGVIDVPNFMVGVLVSIAMSLPFFLIILILTGRIESLINFSLRGYICLVAAGIIHFVVGRSFFFKSIQLIGANITSVLRRVDSLVALVLGVAFLGEPLSFQLVLGIVLITFGVIVTGLNTQKYDDRRKFFLNTSYKAMLYGCGAGICWGVSPIIVKIGLRGSSSPLAGVFISFLAATIVLGISIPLNSKRNDFTGLNARTFGIFTFVGVAAATANFLRFLALKLSPASVVTPLFATTTILVLTISFLINRNLEIFTLPVIIGAAAVVVGSFLIV